MHMRYAAARAVLGDSFERVRSARVLIVGAGGIGCEVLKDTVLAGIGHIEIIDLDTIDLSNLNRQFLFRKAHIGRSKALVARDAAAAFNRDATIIAHHANVMAPEFSAAFYASFDVVLSALDNLETRRWVNRMCVAADVPCIESGSAGLLGQVQPIRPRRTECYDCTAHPTPTTFPVCTIRSTPSTPVHCIVWAKSWLFPQLFGADEDADADEQELAAAEHSGEDAAELANLRREARRMRELKDELRAAGEKDAPLTRIFDKLYDTDIRRLLSMEDMWARRTRPTPLTLADARARGDYCRAAGGLRDQQMLGVSDNADAFMRHGAALAARSGTQEFDKDDEDALAFVAAAANLRAHIYAIPTKTRFEAKQIAGNIIPAVATTNAVVSGLAVMQALHVLAQRWDALRVVSLARRATRAFTTFAPAPPNPACAVCHDVYVGVRADPERARLDDVLGAADRLGLARDALSIAAGPRILYDMDLDDNVPKTLAQLGVHVGDMLTLTDEDGVRATVQLMVGPASDAALALDAVPDVPERPRVDTAPASDDDDDDVAVVAPPRKRAAEDAAPAPRKRAAEDAAPAPRKRAATEDEPARKRQSTATTIVLD